MSRTIRLPESARVVRDLALLGFDALACTLDVRRSEEHGDIAVARLDGIGDFVLWLDAFAALRTLYNGRRITLICNQAWSDLAERVSGFDEIIPVQVARYRTDLRYRYETLRALRRRRFATVIHPLYTRQGFSDIEAIVRALRADEKIGSSGDPSVGWRSRLGGWWFSRLVPASNTPLMELQRNAEFVRALGVGDYRGSAPTLQADRFPRSPLDLDDYYVLFAGASDAIKQWPPRSFAEIGRQIFERTGLTGVVCGGPDDAAQAEEIVAHAGVPLQNWTGRTTLPQLVSIIAGSRLVVSNDTGAMHIAAAVATPAVCVVGGGHFGRFLPYTPDAPDGRPLPRIVFHRMNCFHCSWRCVHPIAPGAAAPCVERVALDAVYREVEAALACSGSPVEPSGVES